MSATTTEAPFSDSRLAMTLPIAPAAPVTSATLPFKSQRMPCRPRFRLCYYNNPNPTGKKKTPSKRYSAAAPAMLLRLASTISRRARKTPHC